MSIQTNFFNWATSGLPYSEPPFEDCSPNLVQLRKYLRERWGGYSLGCEGDRPIREGTAISSHAFGAAEDWRYTPVVSGSKDVPRHVAIGEVLPFVINHSAELHIDAIHDYFGDRIWRAGRTPYTADAHTSWWKQQNGNGSGMGETWATYFHFETNYDGWGDATAIVDRLHGAPPDPGPTPPVDPPTTTTEEMMMSAFTILAKRQTNGSWWAGNGYGRIHVNGKDFATNILAAADGAAINAADGKTVTNWDGVTAIGDDDLERLLGPWRK